MPARSAVVGAVGGIVRAAAIAAAVTTPIATAVARVAAVAAAASAITATTTTIAAGATSLLITPCRLAAAGIPARAVVTTSGGGRVPHGRRGGRGTGCRTVASARTVGAEVVAASAAGLLVARPLRRWGAAAVTEVGAADVAGANRWIADLLRL